MTNFILHHYPLSPYSQKIRSMLGYTQLDWQSVQTREMPPRPSLALLCGGYRRVPVAQIGADIFCDTRTITSEIAQLSGKNELAAENCSEQVKDLLTQLESDVFFTCVGNAMSFRVLWDSFSIRDLCLFIFDRIKMKKSLELKNEGIKKSRIILNQHLERLESLLTENFIGGNAPNIVDFAAYHCLWFVRDVGKKDLIDSQRNVISWMNRIREFNEGNEHPISASDANATAAKCEPRHIPDEHKKDSSIGAMVEISPTDYALDPTDGLLVGCTSYSWIIAREVEKLGTIHVHFPKHGFELKALT